MLRNVTTILAALLIAVVPSALAQSALSQFEVALVKMNKVFIDLISTPQMSASVTSRLLLR